MTAAPEDLTVEVQNNIKEELQEEAPSNTSVEIIVIGKFLNHISDHIMVYKDHTILFSQLLHQRSSASNVLKLSLINKTFYNPFYNQSSIF